MLNRTNYPDSYLTITQPFINSGGQFRGACNILIRERTLSNLFLPTEKWRNDGLFYLVRDDGTLLSQYRCNGAALSFSGMKRESNGMMGRSICLFPVASPALAPAP